MMDVAVENILNNKGVNHVTIAISNKFCFKEKLWKQSSLTLIRVVVSSNFVIKYNRLLFSWVSHEKNASHFEIKDSSPNLRDMPLFCG